MNHNQARTRIMIDSSFGNAVRALRNQCGFTQQQMSNALGISIVTLSRYENDHRLPDGYYVYKLWQFAETKNCEAQAQTFHRILSAGKKSST